MDIPSFQDFCLRTPLYQEFDIEKGKENRISELHHGALIVDCHCIDCDKESVFHAHAIQPPFRDAITIGVNFRQVFWRQLHCSRNNLHVLHFGFCVVVRKVSKIGQTPAFADLAHPEIRKYRPTLKDDYAEFAKGVGLASHGIGIGAFVYMRRIFERLVEKAHAIAQAEQGWSEGDYLKSRMDDKIQLLKSHLPSFLVENRSLYSIMSKGIHELSEDECREHFDVVKVGIELILDEEEAERQKKLKIEAAKKAIQQSHQKIVTQ